MKYFSSGSLRFSGSRALQLVVLAGVASLPFATVHAQSTTGDQYTGVSQPPADDTIIVNEETPAPAQKKPMPGAPAAAVVTAPGKPAPAPVAPPPPRTLENPDYGAITQTTDSIAAEHSASANNAHLVSRPQNPAYGIVGMVPAAANELAEGTNLEVRLVTPLDSAVAQDGQEFRAQVAKNIYKDGRVVIPVGSELRGHLTQVSHGHRLGARAALRLRPETVILPDGTAYHLYAQAIYTSEPGTKIDDEGGVRTKAHVVKDAVELGGGAGGGAAVGAILGGPVGAGAGAIVGASMATTHLLLQKPAQAQIAQGTEIIFSLTEPMDILPTSN